MTKTLHGWGDGLATLNTPTLWDAEAEKEKRKGGDRLQQGPIAAGSKDTGP